MIVKFLRGKHVADIRDLFDFLPADQRDELFFMMESGGVKLDLDVHVTSLITSQNDTALKHK